MFSLEGCGVLDEAAVHVQDRIHDLAQIRRSAKLEGLVVVELVLCPRPSTRRREDRPCPPTTTCCGLDALIWVVSCCRWWTRSHGGRLVATRTCRPGRTAGERLIEMFAGTPGQGRHRARPAAQRRRASRPRRQPADRTQPAAAPGGGSVRRPGPRAADPAAPKREADPVIRDFPIPVHRHRVNRGAWPKKCRVSSNDHQLSAAKRARGRSSKHDGGARRASLSVR